MGDRAKRSFLAVGKLGTGPFIRVSIVLIVLIVLIALIVLWKSIVRTVSNNISRAEEASRCTV